MDDKLTLSVSRSKTYIQCPRRYKFTYEDKLPRKNWVHFDIGSLTHGALEIFHTTYKNGKSPPENPALLMKTAFLKQQEKMEKEKKTFLSSGTITEARDLLRGYMLNLKNNGLKSEVLNVEQKFNLDLTEQISIQGFIDRFDLDEDGKFHIKDYKTNESINYMEPFQLNAYGIYLLDKLPDVNMFKGSYIMLRFDGRHLTYDFNREDVEKIKKELIDIGNRIKEEERWISKPSNLCDWCDYKDICFNSW